MVHDEYGAYIADNVDAIFAGDISWGTWSGDPCIQFGPDFRFFDDGPWAYSATWNVPSWMPAGTYNVYAFFPCGIYNREPAVYYTVNRSGGSDVVGPFDQSDPANKGQWKLLKDNVGFDAGSGSVVLSGSDSSTGILDADAIKWEPVP